MTEDHRAAILVKAKKWNAETQQWTEAAFLNVHILELDKDGKPVVTGTKKIGKREVEQHKIIGTLRLPMSSLNAVMTGAQRTCYLFLAPKKW